MTTKRRKNKVFIVSFILVFMGVCCFIYDYYKNYNVDKINEEKIELFFEETHIENEKKNDKNSNENNKKNDEYKEDYIAILEIPKINLKRGIVDKNSYRNNVNYNIEIINPSSMPDEENGNLILASHSGNGYNAYFRNLYLLKKDNLSYIYYNGFKYVYKVVDKYNDDKDGKIVIKRRSDVTTLTMITCNPNKKTKQIVIISELVKIEKY